MSNRASGKQRWVLKQGLNHACASGGTEEVGA